MVAGLDDNQIIIGHDHDGKADFPRTGSNQFPKFLCILKYGL